MTITSIKFCKRHIYEQKWTRGKRRFIDYINGKVRKRNLYININSYTNFRIVTNKISFNISENT